MTTPSKRYKALLQQRADLVKEQAALFAAAEGRADMALTDDEKSRDDAITATLQTVAGELEREDRRRENERAVQGAPAYNKLPRGDNFGQAFGHWVRTGDKGALNADGFGVEGTQEGYTISAASNATDMNIGTAADGGDTVPTGFYNQIIARRDESMLAARLPIMRIPGVGTTVDVPYDNEADGEFVTKAEANAFDLDAPAVAKKSLTLVNYTKYTDVSYQLLDDSGVNLMAFLSDFVGRGMAKTHNNLLLTEVAASGTSFKTFASATAIAFGEPEAILGNNDLADYLDEDGAVAWVMRSSTHWAIKSLVSTSTRLYTQDTDSGRQMLGYPVLFSQKAAAPAASAKSVYFGNWRRVGMREGNGLTFIRDPYTVAINAQVRLLWNFRTVYGVLTAEAIGYGVHPSA